ncbi:MAG: transporter substrate-binding domain-containing protein [Anaerolineae bacterium]|nr:transporter substrate-binding domain-containing protein [Anaerolineae bacterium]
MLSGCLLGAGALVLSDVHTRAQAEQRWARTQASGMLRVGTDPSVRPFSFFGEASWEGFEADVARALAEQLDLRLQPIPVGYDGFYDALIAGYVDVSMSMLTPDPMRTADFVYSRPYFDAGVRVIATQRALRTLDSLRGLTVAVERGSEADRIARWLERRIPGLRRRAYDSPAEVLSAVEAGEVDAAFLPAPLAIARGCAPLDTESDGCLSPNPVPYVLAARRADFVLVDQINRALDALETKGTLIALARRWLAG